jgi:tRNA A64-2'-O-ribosylphosphate transferase
MPDALSKTVPIWCAVINKLLFEKIGGNYSFHTPTQSVSESEHSQIEQRLDEFVRQAKVKIARLLKIWLLTRPKALQLDMTSFWARLKKPLRPFWVTRDSSTLANQYEFHDCHPVVLCTASRRVRGAELSEGGYIQV